VPRDAVWFVRDGLLVCKGTPLGVLHTESAFKNFRLVVDYRWAPGTKPGNNGILTRINGAARALPRCAEVQLQHGSAGDVLGLQGMMVSSGQPRYFEVMNHALAGDIRGVKKLADAERPAGEWNRVELLARDGNYTVWMNGRQINDASGVEVQSGPTPFPSNAISTRDYMGLSSSTPTPISIQARTRLWPAAATPITQRTKGSTKWSWS
jgi:hypothetical protein